MDDMLNVAHLVMICERIEGRKKLQKIVHILQEAGYPFREEFDYFHFGPYSSALKREIDELILPSVGLVEEEPTHEEGQYKSYVYRSTAKLQGNLERLHLSLTPLWAEQARELNTMSASELEAVSTILFLRRRGFIEERLERRFKELKPHLESGWELARDRAETYVNTH